MSQEDLSLPGVQTPPVNSTGSIRLKELQRNQVMSRLLSDKRNLSQFELMNLHQLEVKLTLLERACDSFEKIQIQLETLDESQFAQNHRNIFEDAYFSVKSSLLERISNLRSNLNQSEGLLSSTHIHQTAMQPTKIHLPTLQLTKFNGNQTEWLDFYNMFCVLVHNNPDLSPISKFQYLRSCLIDSAAKLVQSLEVTEENYERALNILISRYENKFEIFQSHLQHMFEVQNIKQPSVSALRDFIDSITADLRALESIATKPQIADGILLHMVVSKLDTDTQAKWQEETSTNLVRPSLTTLKLPSWENLSNFLERRCKALNIINSNTSYSRTFTQTNRSLVQKNRGSFLIASNQQSTCRICNLSPSHNACHCTKFVKMNVKDRFAIVKRNKLCLNCLGYNHIAASCPSPNRCRYCKDIHHSLLHRAEPNSSIINKSLSISDESSSQICSTPSGSNENQTNQPTQTTTLQVVKEKSEVILATAMVELCNETGVSIVARALLDSCSQLNFITKRVAQFLKLPGKKVNVEISGLGNKSVSAYYMCSIKIKSTTNEFIAPIDVVVIPCISSRHPQQYIDISNWHIPSNIKLANKQFNFPGAVDLLIGAEFFWDLLMVGRIKIDKQPNFIKTMLGWVVTGSAVTFNSPQPSSNKMSSTLSITANKKALFSISSNSPNCSKNDICSSTLNSLTLSLSNTTTPKAKNNCLQTTSADYFKLNCDTINVNYKAFITISSEPLLENLLEKFWTIDELLVRNKNILSHEELQCEKFFYETTKRCPKTNKFIVRLPFKADPSILGESFHTAYIRFSYLESKFLRDSNIYKDYNKFMDEYLYLKHMQPASSLQDVKYFIPHHCITKPDSSTTRLRVVFDASCCTTSGKSLNDILCVGPTLQDDIFTMLSRFRYHKYVLVADIAKMYRQVLVHNDDMQWQCILWRSNPSSPLIAYKLQTLTYGTSSAPYLAVKCLQQLASEMSDTFPLGAKVTLSDFYVDNLMTGGKSEDEVIEIKRQVVGLLKSGGFPLRKFASNSSNILLDIPNAEREEIVQLDNMDYIKTLGLKWSPKEDFFSFSYTPQDSTLKSTKRSILAHTAAFFDPLGLINPIIVKAKILLQSLWKLKLHWDESVPLDIFTEWEQIRAQLKCLNNIKIPRFVSFNSFTNIHAFADASKKAYGACIYVVSKCEDGMVSSLVCAKSRVAPVKEVSLPRLELCAALLSVKLLDAVRNYFPKHPCKTFCWSDSTITLAWIAGESYSRPTFVANRITKIQELSKDVVWKHVPSEQNPADLLSRGSTVKCITENDFWFQGPSFLREAESNWPRQPPLSVQDFVEQRQTSLIAKNCGTCTIYEDFLEDHKFINSFEKLLRMMVYVKRFITFSNTSKKMSFPITTEEIFNALLTCCGIVQRSHFANEYKQLNEGKSLKNHKIIQLSPFLKDGLIRVGGRLKNSSLSFSAKHPVLLPNKHPFVKTLITHYHRKYFHAGVLSLHNTLREQFWIINGRNTIKKIIHSCVFCFRYRPKLQEQVMAALPADRVQASFPFQVSGVDYCGPFQITQRVRGRSPIKGYISLFICFSTKAIHMELVPDLTTIAFIAALRRFISRRGRCATIYSDNATNFIGANKELKAMLSDFLSEEHIEVVREACLSEGITWNFIPPRSPHFGGLWESGVKQAKHYLRRAIGKHILTYDELNTVVCQTEAILNSRPLTPLSSDPNDLRPLTPAHFLIGRPLTSLPEPNLCTVNPSSLKSYKLIQWIQQHFWERWRKEYLNCLQQKLKWNTASPNIEINDLVLLKDDNIPPLKWPLARVIAVNPGDDGFVRVATVKSKDGVFKRAITKLCKLPLEQ